MRLSGLITSLLVGVAVCTGLGSSANGQSVLTQNVAGSAAERISFTRQPVSLIPAGTQFGEEPPEGWSHVISLVRSQLNRGDFESVSDTVRYYGELFNLVMLGNVQTNADGKFELDQVAIGFSIPIQGLHTIVTSDTQHELGGNLNIIGRGVLDGNTESLATVQQVARTKNSLMIDAPAIMLRDGKHRAMVIRYYIWVFPENGNLGTLVWLLDSTANSPSNSTANSPALSVADPSMQLLPPNMQEDRSIHVDGTKFSLFGIPAKDAFALVQISPGVAFTMSEELQRLAAEKTYTAETWAALMSTIAQTLLMGKQATPAGK